MLRPRVMVRMRGNCVGVCSKGYFKTFIWVVEAFWRMKKGDISWDTIVKLVLVVALLLFVILMIYLLRDKIGLAGMKVNDFLRFGS